jgi:hypothetical protein
LSQKIDVTVLSTNGVQIPVSSQKIHTAGISLVFPSTHTASQQLEIKGTRLDERSFSSLRLVL